MNKKYKLVNQDDVNEEIHLGEHKNEKEATNEALNQLGWSLVEIKDDDDTPDFTASEDEQIFQQMKKDGFNPGRIFH